MSEFGEPWEGHAVTSIDERTDAIMLESRSHGRIKLSFSRGLLNADQMQAMQERVAACINACAGISTADLDRASRLMPTLAANLTVEQKAELLSKLETAGPEEVVAIPSEMEYLPEPLAWRKEPPDRSGWWWMLPPDHEPIAICAMADRHGHVMVSFGSTICYVDDKYLAKCLWAGPIEPPPVPG